MKCTARHCEHTPQEVIRDALNRLKRTDIIIGSPVDLERSAKAHINTLSTGLINIPARSMPRYRRTGSL